MQMLIEESFFWVWIGESTKIAQKEFMGNRKRPFSEVTVAWIDL